MALKVVRLRRTVWSCFFLALLVTACSGGEQKDSQSAETRSDEIASSQANASAEGVSPDSRVKNLDKLVDLLVAEAAELPRTEFDPAALAAKLGKNPQAHFDWVRDRTWWAPYRGLLRGSQGVMLDRVGSNLDRAVLLGDLLRHAGYNVRLAHAQLPTDAARELLDKVRPIPNLRRDTIAPNPASTSRQRTVEAILPGFTNSFQEEIAGSQRRARDAKSMVRSHGNQLYAAVRDIAMPDTEGDSKAIAALRDHWWVEREENGKWIAMDVLLPNAKESHTLATATQFIDWGKDSAAPAIPASDWHSVKVRVVVERYESGATTESTVLETVLRPAEVLERPITLMHMPRPWPSNLPDPNVDPDALGNAAVNVKEWIPFLQIGDELVAQSGFTESGDLITDPLNPQRDIAAAGGGGFMSGFDAALGGGETAPSSVTAEWIDYEIRVPGETGERLRRPVFDVLGPANRAAKTDDFDASTNDRLVERYGALLSSTDILLQPCDFSEEFVVHLATASIVSNHLAIKELALERDKAKSGDLASTILGRMIVWGPLPDLVLWRSALGDDPRDWFIDRPNVLNYRATLPVVAGGQSKLHETIDVASNSIGVRRAARGKSFDVRLRQGVADTVAEIVALGSGLSGAENTASIFAEAGVESGYGSVIAGRDAEKSVRELGWPADVAARVTANIDAGFVAVVVDEPVQIHGRERMGWWRVDPVSGETVGVMDTGLHANTIENVEIHQLINALRTFLRTNARTIRAARRARSPTNRQQVWIRLAEHIEDALAGAVPPPV